MVVAGTVVVIVSLVLFSQIRDQLLDVKRQAAIDQARAGVTYAQTQVAGISTGDAASVRTALDRTVTQLRARSGAAGTFEVVMVHRTGEVERTAPSPSRVFQALPGDLRALVDDGRQGWRYSLVPDELGEPQPTDRKSTRLNSSHANISYAVFCLKKKKKIKKKHKRKKKRSNKNYTK